MLTPGQRPQAVDGRPGEKRRGHGQSFLGHVVAGVVPEMVFAGGLAAAQPDKAGRDALAVEGEVL